MQGSNKLLENGGHASLNPANKCCFCGKQRLGQQNEVSAPHFFGSREVQFLTKVQPSDAECLIVVTSVSQDRVEPTIGESHAYGKEDLEMIHGFPRVGWL